MAVLALEDDVGACDVSCASSIMESSAAVSCERECECFDSRVSIAKVGGSGGSSRRGADERSDMWLSNLEVRSPSCCCSRVRSFVKSSATPIEMLAGACRFPKRNKNHAD